MASSPPGGNQQQPNVFAQSANALNAGANAAMNAANYQPMQVRAATVNPATVGRTNLNQYMNPFQQQVIDTTMADLNRQQQMTQNQLGAQATAAGAFGGSRHGVAMGETNDAYARQQAAALAGLNSQNFMNAQQQAQFDSGQLNQGRQFNANSQMQARLANQQAGLNAANLGLSGAQTLGNLSNTGFGQGMAITGQQAAMGAQQQALNQALINAQQGQFAGFTGAPAQSLGMQLGALGAVPFGQTQTQTKTPGLFDWLTLGMQI